MDIKRFLKKQLLNLTIAATLTASACATTIMSPGQREIVANNQVLSCTVYGGANEKEIKAITNQLESKGFVREGGRLYFTVKSKRYADEQSARDDVYNNAASYVLKQIGKQKDMQDITVYLAGIRAHKMAVYNCGGGGWIVEATCSIGLDDYNSAVNSASGR